MLLVCDSEYFPSQYIIAAIGSGIYVYSLLTKNVIAYRKTAHDSDVLHTLKLPNGYVHLFKGLSFYSCGYLRLCPKYSFSGSSWIAFCTGSILNNRHLGNMCSHRYEMHLLKSNTCL